MIGVPVKRGLQSVMTRRGVKQIGLGLSLLLPATAFMARVPETGSGSQSGQQQEATLTRQLGLAWTDAVGTTDATNADAASDMTSAESSEAVQALADEYNVPVTLASDIHEAAVTASIDPKIAFGLVRAESHFSPTIVSPVGAVGLTQVMPATAKWLVPGTTKSDLRDPETNLRVGFKYLRSLLDQFEGNEKLALTAYNRGPGVVSKILHRGGDPDNGYAEMVMTGKSAKHVRLMNAKFGRKHATVKHASAKRVTKKHPARATVKHTKKKA